MGPSLGSAGLGVAEPHSEADRRPERGGLLSLSESGPDVRATENRSPGLISGEEFEVVQKEVAEMLRGRILVGHALHNDLKVWPLAPAARAPCLLAPRGGLSVFECARCRGHPEQDQTPRTELFPCPGSNARHFPE